METAEDRSPSRHRAIVTALAAEIERQARAGASRIDIEALAVAAEAAIEARPPAAAGRHPSELNATNDD